MSYRHYPDRQLKLIPVRPNAPRIAKRVADQQKVPITKTAVGLVGLGGLEPPTSRLSGVRSNHLSYRPRPASFYRMIIDTYKHKTVVSKKKW